MSALFAISALLAAACVAQDGERREVEVLSASARFVGSIRKATGQERVAEALARWRLTVQAIDRDGRRSDAWSCVVQHRPGQRSYYLSDDGLAFVEVDPGYDSKRELVRVWRDERELVALDAEALAVERAPGSWLAAERGASVGWLETPTGPVPQLFLELASGGLRRVDLASGAVASSREWIGELTCEPAVDSELRAVAVAPYVKSALAPATLHWGEVLEIRVSGSHPTPNWRCVGFEGRFEGEKSTQLVLTPLSAPPPRNSVQLQVLEGFESTARIGGLAPGRYTVQVTGRGDARPDPIAVEVLPARAWLELRTRGGFIGIDESVRVFVSGVVVTTNTRATGQRVFRVLDAQERTLLGSAFEALPRQPKSSRTPGAADMFEYTLRWTAAGKELAWSFDDGSADAAGRELVRTLREGAARANK